MYTSSRAALDTIAPQYAVELPRVKSMWRIRLAAKDFGGADVPNTVTQDADAVLRLATLEADGPTGPTWTAAVLVP